MSHHILIPDETRAGLADYEAAVRSGAHAPGGRLAASLAGADDFLTALLRTKLPQSFAESAVAGDGSDWNLTELGLLGDTSVAMEVAAARLVNAVIRREGRYLLRSNHCSEDPP